MTTASSNTIKILRTVQQVRQWRRQCLLNGKTVGFIPTMGALHSGHCSLISQSLKDNHHTIVSIFVNPSQFAPHEDLEAYPRTLESDLKILEDFPKGNVVDAVFVPKISEMYPSGITLEVPKQKGAFVTVQGCSEQLEGASRPAFFRGVATVVTKLLNIVTPDQVYFGQKDAQQCVVIKNLVKDLLIDTNVNVLPTLRESNGLALSSRNAYLSDEVRDQSSIIYRALSNGKTFYETSTKKTNQPVKSSDILNEIHHTLESKPDNFNIEYISINHPQSLEELEFVEPGVGAIISTAVRVPKEKEEGEARLIDNVVLS